MVCSICNKEKDTVRTGIKNGQYIENACESCFNSFTQSGVYARKYERDRQREDYRKDLIQRFDGDKINPEFIKAYPERAREQWGDEIVRGYTDNQRFI